MASSRPDDNFERQFGYPQKRVAGVDEVGRGPLAGPVVAAAAILPSKGFPEDLAKKINDSKKLSPDQRAELSVEIVNRCVTAIGVASEEEIDTINILQASLLAMRRAVEGLSRKPEVALIDGNRCPENLPCPAHPIVKGDGKSLSIAAASIIAKVHRDTLMADLAKSWPGYGWESNAGYPTVQHREALKRLGVTPHHRRSFAPVSQLIGVRA